MLCLIPGASAWGPRHRGRGRPRYLFRGGGGTGQLRAVLFSFLAFPVLWSIFVVISGPQIWGIWGDIGDMAGCSGIQRDTVKIYSRAQVLFFFVL